MEKDERIKKSYDFAADLSKQMITLSTAIITLCVAFTDKVFTSEAAQANSCWLMWSLGVFVVSISVGVFHLMGLTGQLGKEDETQNTIPPEPHVAPQAGAPAQAGNEHGVGESRAGTPVKTNNDVSIYSPTNRITSLTQVLTFVAGLALALTYLGKSIPSAPIEKEQPKEVVDTTKCIKILRTSEYVIINGERADTLYLMDGSRNNGSQK